MRTVRLGAGMLAISCFVFAAGGARAATWYVAPPPAGDDGNSGNTGWGSPFATIQHAIDSAGSSDTVLVSNGTYSIGASIMITNGSVSGLTVKSVNGPNNTSISASSSGYRLVYISGASGVILDGFSITGARCEWVVGAGVFVDGNLTAGTEATIRNCMVTNNSTLSAGGGIACGRDAVTLIRNCLVAGNYGQYGSGIAGRNGTPGVSRTTIENTTIAGNDGGVYGGGLYSEHGYETFGVNLIVYNNSNGGDVLLYGATYTYTCAGGETVLPGAGNTRADPQFIANGTGLGLTLAGYNYRLQSGSPCLNTGLDAPWMSDPTVDLDGAPRLYGAHVDMGAYELGPPPLGCTFTGTPNRGEGPYGLGPLTAVFTSTAIGDATGIQYRWDFNADGTFDTPWSTGNQSTNTYDFGVYSVACAVTNGAGEYYVWTNVGFVVSSPSVMYVALSGGNTFPYTNWSMAATTISPAVALAADGATIIVSNGTYTLASQITVAKAIAFRSLNGPTTTILNGNHATRHFKMIAGATNWVIDGFTLCNGTVNEAQGGTAVRAMGAGVKGLIVNCIVTNNNGGDYVPGALVTGDNAETIHRNCLIAFNTAGWGAGGIDARNQNAKITIENCTLYSNRVHRSDPYDAPVGYGDETGPGNTMVNTILYENTIVEGNATACSYSLNAGAGTGNRTGDPKFVNAVGGDFRLQSDSPCVNQGVFAAWMTGATDLTGNPRVKVGAVDMGAYEWMPPLGTSIYIR